MLDVVSLPCISMFLHSMHYLSGGASVGHHWYTLVDAQGTTRNKVCDSLLNISMTYFVHSGSLPFIEKHLESRLQRLYQALLYMGACGIHVNPGLPESDPFPVLSKFLIGPSVRALNLPAKKEYVRVGLIELLLEQRGRRAWIADMQGQWRDFQYASHSKIIHYCNESVPSLQSCH